MEINGSITIYIDAKGAHIQIEDRDTNIEFCNIRMSPEQFLAALGRQCNVKVESMEVRGLTAIGKAYKDKC